MTVMGDRAVASLLSALAEAPDFPAAAAFLLSQLVEITGAPRACMLRLDPPQESIALVSSVGFDPSPDRPSRVLIGDLSSPLVIAVLSLRPLRGNVPLAVRGLSGLADWIALPMSQPRPRGGSEAMSAQRATELATAASVTVLPIEGRANAAPGGVVVL